MITTPKMFIVATLCQGSMGAKRILSWFGRKTQQSQPAQNIQHSSTFNGAQNVEWPIVRCYAVRDNQMGTDDMTYLKAKCDLHAIEYYASGKIRIDIAPTDDNLREEETKKECTLLNVIPIDDSPKFELTLKHESRTFAHVYYLPRGRDGWEIASENNIKDMQKIMDHCSKNKNASAQHAKHLAEKERQRQIDATPTRSRKRMQRLNSLELEQPSNRNMKRAHVPSAKEAADKAAAEKLQKNLDIVDRLFSYSPFCFGAFENKVREVKKSMKDGVRDLEKFKEKIKKNFTPEQLEYAIRELNQYSKKDGNGYIGWSEIEPSSVVTPELIAHFEMNGYYM